MPDHCVTQNISHLGIHCPRQWGTAETRFINRSTYSCFRNTVCALLWVVEGMGSAGGRKTITSGKEKSRREMQRSGLWAYVYSRGGGTAS